MQKALRVVMLGLGCAVALSGCGSSSGARHPEGGGGGNREASKSPAQILTDAAAALRNAHGFVIEGVMTQNGRTARLKVVTPGSGSLEMTISSGNASAEMIVLASGSYVRGNTEFWARRAGTRASLLANRWIEVPAANAQAFTSALGHFAPATMARCLVEGHGTLSLAGRTTVAGRPAIVIRDAGNAPGSAPGKLAVATSGPPYPLQATTAGPQRAGGRIDACNDGRASDTHGRLTLSHFGAVPKIQPPPNPIRLGQTAA